MIGFDTETGERRFRRDVPLEMYTAEQFAVTSDSVHLSGGELRAYDLTTGTEQWSHTLSGAGGRITACQSSVYCCGDAFVVALDHDGTERWRVTLDSVPIAPPAIVDESLYVATQSGVVALSE